MGLKLWGGCFDGTMHLVVAARNQAEAAKALGVSVYNLRNYGDTIDGEWGPVTEWALEKPGAVFSKPLAVHDDNLYVEGERRWRRGEPWPPHG